MNKITGILFLVLTAGCADCPKATKISRGDRLDMVLGALKCASRDYTIDHSSYDPIGFDGIPAKDAENTAYTVVYVPDEGIEYHFNYTGTLFKTTHPGHIGATKEIYRENEELTINIEVDDMPVVEFLSLIENSAIMKEGLRFSCDNLSKTVNLTITQKNMSFGELLELLEHAYDLRFEIKDKVLFVTKELSTNILPPGVSAPSADTTETATEKGQGE